MLAFSVNKPFASLTNSIFLFSFIILTKLSFSFYFRRPAGRLFLKKLLTNLKKYDLILSCVIFTQPFIINCEAQNIFLRCAFFSAETRDPPSGSFFISIRYECSHYYLVSLLYNTMLIINTAETMEISHNRQLLSAAPVCGAYVRCAVEVLT